MHEVLPQRVPAAGPCVQQPQEAPCVSCECLPDFLILTSYGTVSVFVAIIASLWDDRV